MASTINASTSAGLVSTADTSGVLQLQTAGTTAVSIDASQAVTFSAGTANGVSYLNGSKVLTTGSALTFDGTNLGIGGTQSYSGYRTLLVQGTNASNGGVVQIQNSDSSVQAYWLNTSALVSFGSITSTPLGFLIGNSEQMRLTSTGLGIGTSSPSASAILDAQSTTKGVRMPNMTTTQKNAIASPAAGLMVFDTTLAKLCVYSGSAWQTITSV